MVPLKGAPTRGAAIPCRHALTKTGPRQATYCAESTAVPAPAKAGCRPGNRRVKGLAGVVLLAAWAEWLPAQVVARHAVQAKVEPVVSIRDARVTIEPAAPSQGWSWHGSVRGNAPFRLEVRIPAAADSGGLRARAGGGEWVALVPGAWALVATGRPGHHALRVDIMAGPGARAGSPEVRAMPR